MPDEKSLLENVSLPANADDNSWTMDDLVSWDEKIRDLVDAFGLNCFEQEFEICDHEQMLGYMAYHGMPAHYPHWSFGKSFERQKTQYDLQVSGLPYEMVINSDPSVAYLMRGNSLCLQILTIAHVYGHNDFFRNNFTFRHTDPTGLLSRINVHGGRVRDYMRDPSIGVKRVEPVLDACHALSLQVNRNPSVKRLSRENQEARLIESAQKDRSISEKKLAKQLQMLLIQPEQDLLVLLRDHAPDLTDWERDVINICHQEALYFLPQIETKIINEGWASFWHHQIMSNLDLPSGVRMEFMVRHHQVIRPIPGDVNPYHVGFMTWRKIAKEALGISDEDDDGGPLPLLGPQAAKARETLFQIREVDRDVSFLRRFLDEELMRDLDIFEFEEDSNSGDVTVSKVSDEQNWLAVKNTLLKQVGIGGVPIITATEIDVKKGHQLKLLHEQGERELDPENTRHTLSHIYQLWRRPVTLETKVDGKATLYQWDDEGFSRKD